MKKNIFILFILLVFVSFPTYSFDFKTYENKLKIYDFYNFTNPPEVQKEKDNYGRYIRNIYYTAIAFKKDEPYQFTNDGKYRVVKKEKNFELKYFIGPVLPVPSNSINFYCFQNLPIKQIDNRFYSFPIFEDLDGNSPIIKENEFRIAHGNTIYKDFSPNYAEKSYKYFDFIDGKLISLNPVEVRNKQFTVCIESLNNQFPTNNRESLDITYKAYNEDAKEEVSQMMRRSYFGLETSPELDIDKENERILNFKTTDNRTIQQQKSYIDKLSDFSFSIVPLLLITSIPVYFVFRYISSKLREKEINKKIKDIE